MEGWSNIVQKDIEDLEIPDKILLRKILSTAGNPCTVFMQLEMGIIPVKYVIIKKRMIFLHYILNESIDCMIRQVFTALKEDSRKGDFIFMSNNDRIELEINKTDEKIAEITKYCWKKYVKERVKSSALTNLCIENSKKEKTQNIWFDKLEMSKYLQENKRTSLSKVIFSVRSKTLDVKEWFPWKYDTVNCVACGNYPETIDHF